MNEINNGLYDALYADAAVLADVGTRIYRGRAAQGATYPLITFQKVGGGDENRTPREAVDVLYLVQALSLDSPAAAETIAGHIHAALHRKPFTVSGWTNIWTAVANHLEAVELVMDAGKLSWHAGRMIRIRLSK